VKQANLNRRMELAQMCGQVSRQKAEIVRLRALLFASSTVTDSSLVLTPQTVAPTDFPVFPQHILPTEELPRRFLTQFRGPRASLFREPPQIRSCISRHEPQAYRLPERFFHSPG
jgi:hypothetical protein